MLEHASITDVNTKFDFHEKPSGMLFYVLL